MGGPLLNHPTNVCFYATSTLKPLSWLLFHPTTHHPPRLRCLGLHPPQLRPSEPLVEDTPEAAWMDDRRLRRSCRSGSGPHKWPKKMQLLEEFESPFSADPRAGSSDWCEAGSDGNDRSSPGLHGCLSRPLISRYMYSKSLVS